MTEHNLFANHFKEKSIFILYLSCMYSLKLLFKYETSFQNKSITQREKVNNY